MAQFTNLDQMAGLGKLNSHLASESYVSGYTVSQADLDVHKQVKSQDVDGKKFVHLARWYKHIQSFTPEEVKAAASGAPAPAPAAKKEDDAEFDVFGDETEEDKKNKEEMAKKEVAPPPPKKVLILKSCVILDVKPWEADEDGSTKILDEIEAKVRSVSAEGLEWKAKEHIEVGFGIKKLRIMAHVVDDKVSVDGVIEQIQDENPDLVQSIDIFAFNKL